MQFGPHIDQDTAHLGRPVHHFAPSKAKFDMQKPQKNKWTQSFSFPNLIFISPIYLLRIIAKEVHPTNQ